MEAKKTHSRQYSKAQIQKSLGESSTRICRSVDSLPTEVLALIFAHLEFGDLTVCMRVNSRMRWVLTNPSNWSKTMSLSGNSFETSRYDYIINITADSIKYYLQFISRVETLHVPQRFVHEKTLVLIAPYLRQLLRLDLSGVTLDDECASEILRCCSNLQKVSFSACRYLSYRALESIADYGYHFCNFRSNITHLDISRTKTGTITALSEMFACLPKLSHLDMTWSYDVNWDLFSAIVPSNINCLVLDRNITLLGSHLESILATRESNISLEIHIMNCDDITGCEVSKLREKGAIIKANPLLWDHDAASVSNYIQTYLMV